MSIDRPRRIFRAAARSNGRSVNPTLLAGLLGAVGGGGIMLVGVSGALFGRAPPAATVISAHYDQVAVIDGDTLRLTGMVVRLSDVSAPPRGQACAAGPDCGGRATAALAGLVHDRGVDCAVTGHDPHGRPAAECVAEGVDLNRAMVATGWVRAESATLRVTESAARAARKGLWTDG